MSYVEPLTTVAATVGAKYLQSSRRRVAREAEARSRRLAVDRVAGDHRPLGPPGTDPADRGPEREQHRRHRPQGTVRRFVPRR